MNGVRKPSDPRWKAMMGGTDCWNKEEAYNTTTGSRCPLDRHRSRSCQSGHPSSRRRSSASPGCQHGVVHDGRLNEHHHPLLVDEPLDQLDEGRDHRRVPDLLDDEDCEGWLVPSQSLRGRVLDGPAADSDMLGGDTESLSRVLT